MDHGPIKVLQQLCKENQFALMFWPLLKDSSVLNTLWL